MSPELAPELGALVLVVDDHEENRDLIEEILGDRGYRVRTCADGRVALDMIEKEPPDCVVLDVMMPRMDGYEVCRRLKSDPRTRFLPVVMLTALSDVSDKVRGLESGADDFLNKPVHREELVARVRSLVRIKRLRDELDSSESVIYTLVQALESRDPRCGGHSERVAAAGMAVARRMGLPPREQEAVARGGLLHDLGKLALSDDVFAPPPYTPEQEREYRRHPEMGEQMLLPLRSLAAAREVVRHHHERPDGSGFPDGLFGRELSVASQIVAVANAYEGWIHTDRWTPDTAATRLREEARLGLFNVEVANAFLDSGAAVIGQHGDPPPDAWSEIRPTDAHASTGTILLADDTPANREVFVEVLGEQGYRVVVVTDGEAVIPAVREHDVDLVLLDVCMPKLDGMEVCRRIKSAPDTQYLPVLLVTAFRESGDRMRGVEVGADDFLTQPVNRLELIARVRSLLRLRTWWRDLEDHQDVVLSLASLLESRHEHTRGHSARVGDIAQRMGGALGLPARDAENLRMAGLLHDVGNVGVPGVILGKPAALSTTEHDVMMSHAIRGESLCRPLKSVRGVLPLIRHHHERFAGGGYPDGLAGESIPLGARVVGLADAYDALVSDRPHRARRTVDEALALLDAESREGRWDPALLPVLAQVVRTR